MLIDGYSLVKCIGRGAFGEVYLTSKNETNQLFATKKVSKQKIESPSIKKYFVNEITILKELNHKNIVKLETIRQTLHNFYIITEFYNGGNLSDCLRKHRMIKGKPFSEEIVQYLMRQIVDAIKYLHSKRIIHRDLKLENLLINFESEEDKKNLNMLKAEVKIIDFGFATYLDNTGLRYSILGSPINMDPILLTKLINQNITSSIGYSEKADIWSLGTVCYELITGKAIFRAKNLIDLVRLVEIGSYHIPKDLSQEIVSFLSSMLQYTSTYRLSAEELSNHPFLNKNVNEFTQLDLTKYSNNIDAKGIIFNIKKNPQNERPLYDIQARLNYCQQQQYYQNFKNTNKIYPPAYNYFANTGPKYYKVTTNRPLNSNQLNPSPFQTAATSNNLDNYQNNKLLRKGYTYLENNNIQKEINKNNNLLINQEHKTNLQKINHTNTYINSNIQNLIPIQQNKNPKYDSINKTLDNNHFNPNKIQKLKNKEITGENYGLVPKGSRLPGKFSSTNAKLDNAYSNHNRANQLKSKEEKNKNLKDNNYTNNIIPKTFYDEFFQNTTGIPPLSDALNPSPIPFSGPIPFNKPMKSSLHFSGMNNDNNHNFPVSIFGANQAYNNNSNNRAISNNFGNNFRNNEIKNEISSDALDNLFDFHIGKELDPEPEVKLEKNNQNFS